LCTFRGLAERFAIGPQKAVLCRTAAELRQLLASSIGITAYGWAELKNTYAMNIIAVITKCVENNLVPTQIGKIRYG
jgi:hypothetical protein